jgi:putative ABC transport system permease protein
MMKWFNILTARLRALFRRESVLRDIEEELRVHVEMETETNIKRGMPPDEARAAALKSFGNLRRNAERGYDIRGGGWLETLWQDLRFGARMLMKTPGFTLTAVFTLALGIGANTAIFSVVNAVLINPFPYPAGNRLMTLYRTGDRPPGMLGTEYISPADFAAWRAQQNSFSEMFGFKASYALLTSAKEAAYIPGFSATARFFETLGVKPVLGRGFLPEEEIPGRPRVVVISHAIWQNLLDEDPSVVGKTLRFNDIPHTVIGVLPADFKFIYQVDALFPLELNPNDRAGGWWVIARLKDGVTREQARIETKLITGRLRQENARPGDNQSQGANLVPLGRVTGEDSQRGLLILFSATSFVLLIACANFANLLSARASRRYREMAIRVALGAGRMRLIFQLLTESLLLAALGGMVGILMAWWNLNWLVSLAPAELSRVKEISIDAWVLGFTFLSVIVTGVIFGLAPAFQVSKPDLTKSLKEETVPMIGRGRLANLRNLLIFGEVALAVVLLVGAGLLINSLIRMMRVNPGFASENVLTLNISLPDKYKTGEQKTDLYQRMLERLKIIPGVESAGTIDLLPFGDMLVQRPLFIEGQPELSEDDRPRASPAIVSTNYFNVMQIPLLKGRGFTEEDTKKAPAVVLISESAARRFFAGSDPIGQRIRFDFDRDPNGKPIWLEIVGITGDVKQRELRSEAFPTIYRPMLGGVFVLRSSVVPGSLIASVRNEVQAIDSELAIYMLNTMDDLISETTKRQRFITYLLSIFAALALGLSAVGLYGVTSYIVTRRTREIGIRMALGAQHSDMVRLVIRQGMLPVVMGIIAGLVAAVALARLMRSLLFEVRATAPLTFVMITLLLMLVALLACWIPARRATKVNPLVALRTE